MSIPQPYDTGLTEEQLAEAFRRALGDMTDEEIEKAIATAISLIPKGLVYRGAYNYFSELPTNAKEGEVYTVKYKGTSGTEPDGNEYAWGEYEGTLQWIKLGVNAYTKDEIDEQFQTVKSDILLLEENKMPYKYGRAYANDTNKGNKWYKLATFKASDTASYNATFYITDRRAYQFGFLHICTEKSSTLEGSVIKGQWISTQSSTNEVYDKDKNFVITAVFEGSNLVCELWSKIPDDWHSYTAIQLLNSRANFIQTPDDMGWILGKTTEPYDKPYDTYPELTSPTVRVVYTTDKLADALKKIDNFETRITALENK